MNDVLEFQEKSIEQQFKKLSRKKVILAIDYHEREYYGDKNDLWVVGGKYKNGTCWFHKYATIEIVSERKRLTLFALPVHVFSNPEDVVKVLVERAKRYVNVELVMLDRWFFSGYVIRVLNESRVDFLMVAKKTPRISRMNQSVYGYEINKSKFNLIVKGNRKWATSLGYLPDKFSRIYKRRWRIETGYRTKKDFKIKTRTRNPVIRFLFFVVEILMYNHWIMLGTLPTIIQEYCGKLKRLTTRVFKLKFLGIP